MLVNYNLIGKRIREIRKEKKMSQEKLAEIVDLSTQYISQIETAKRKLSLKTIIGIANALQVSVDELLYGNLSTHSQEYSSELKIIFEDCTTYEKRILYELIIAVKNILRDNHNLL